MLPVYRPVAEEQAVPSPFWTQTKTYLKDGNLSLFVSNFPSHRILAPRDVTKTWAEMVGFPLPLGEHLTRARVAQVYSVQTNDKEAKEDYLRSLKNMLMGRAQAHPNEVDPKLVTRLGRNYQSSTFTELALRLGYLRHDQVQKDPLRLLTELPLHTYITTSHHDFIEVALGKSARKPKPESEICYWRDGLEHIPSAFDDEPGYAPTAERPLVYHLYGIDTYPESLVLTEDDHFQFLVNAAYAAAEVHMSHRTDGRQQGDGATEKRRHLPSCVTRALSGPALMIGFDVFSWEFRTLFKGLIQPKTKSRTVKGVCMQFEQNGGESETERYAGESKDGAKNESEPPGDKSPRAPDDRKSEIKEYLTRLFAKAEFEIFWGTPEQCAATLWEIWES